MTRSDFNKSFQWAQWWDDWKRRPVFNGVSKVIEVRYVDSEGRVLRSRIVPADIKFVPKVWEE
jgi:hypothetical protein